MAAVLLGRGLTTQVGSAHAFGALCQGRPASHPWRDASAPAGPGDEGPDVGDTQAPSSVSGGPGDDTLQHGGSGAPVKMNGDDGFNRCLFRAGDELVNCQG
jgi:hypothetical protein